jgi:hypothetical protein
VAWALVRSGRLVRSLRLAPFATGAAAVAAFLAVRHGDTRDVVGDLRVVGLLLALGSGYALDDPAAVTLHASPYPLARRTGLRLGAAAAFVVAVWVAVLAWYHRWGLGLGLTVELAAALAVTWAVAAWGRRHGFDQPGLATTPALLAALLLAAAVPRAPMLVGPGPGWAAAHLRWSGVLVVAAGALMVALRDPAARYYRTSGGGEVTCGPGPR